MKASRLFVVKQKNKLMTNLGTISRKSYKDNNPDKIDYKPFDVVIGDYVQAIQEQGHQDFLRFDGKELKHFRIN